MNVSNLTSEGNTREVKFFEVSVIAKDIITEESKE